MQYINELKEGQKVSDIYLVKKVTHAQAKNGKEYWSVTLQDKTGTVDGKIWDPGSPAINDFENMDYIWVGGEVTVFNNANQINIRQTRLADAGSYSPADYVPCSERDIDEMYAELMGFVNSVKTPYFNALLLTFFDDDDFKKRFCYHSAARSVHHGFVGGLLEHTLSVTRVCDFFAKNYPILNRDLLLTAAICHDIGKLDELSPYPTNDYTDDGQLIGHIVIGANMVRDAIRNIEGFPKIRENELIHCILSHHGELEFGSPKKPSLAEAVALSFADNTDAKMETMKEALNTSGARGTEWMGFNRYIESNIRRTAVEDDIEEK